MLLLLRHMSVLMFVITGNSTVCLAVFFQAGIKTHQRSALLSFVRGIHWCPVDSPHKRTVMQKMFLCLTSSFLAIVCLRGINESSSNNSVICLMGESLLPLKMVFISKQRPGADSLSAYSLTSIGIPIIKIRWSHERLIFILVEQRL